MGTQPTQVDRNIAQQRQRIGERIDHLRHRLRSDYRESQQMVKQEASQMGQKTKRGLASVAGILWVSLVMTMGYFMWRKGRSHKG